MRKVGRKVTGLVPVLLIALLLLALAAIAASHLTTARRYSPGHLCFEWRQLLVSDFSIFEVHKVVCSFYCKVYDFCRVKNQFLIFLCVVNMLL